MSSRFLAYASELLENHEEMFPWYYMHIVMLLAGSNLKLHTGM